MAVAVVGSENISNLMEYVQLTAIDTKVSRLGFGGCALGGHGWGKSDEDLLRASIGDAVERGVTFFDTADIYGLGQSERLLGEELKGRRDDVVIATKFGVRRIGEATVYDNDPTWMAKAVDASLRRLRTDRIDLYQLHYWDQKTPLDVIQDCAERLIEAGKILSFGVTNFAPNAFRQASTARPASFSFEFNLVKPEGGHGIREVAATTGATFLGWGCLAQGALSGKYPPGHRFGENDRRSRGVYTAFHGNGLERRERVLAVMREIAPHYPGKTTLHIALRWILDELPGAVTLVGIKSPMQLNALFGAYGWTLHPEHRKRLLDESVQVGLDV